MMLPQMAIVKNLKKVKADTVSNQTGKFIQFHGACKTFQFREFGIVMKDNQVRAVQIRAVVPDKRVQYEKTFHASIEMIDQRSMKYCQLVLLKDGLQRNSSQSDVWRKVSPSASTTSHNGTSSLRWDRVSLMVSSRQCIRMGASRIAPGHLLWTMALFTSN